jgi:hypothetical protein
MKYLILTIATVLSLTQSVWAVDTNSPGPDSFHFATPSTDKPLNWETNLVSFFPDVQLAYASQLLASNGMYCGLIILKEPDRQGKPPHCLVSVYFQSTSVIGCLNMPATNLCRIALLDKQGHRVPKTNLGKMYGLPLSQERIGLWQHSWNNPHQRMLIRIIPNGIPKFAGDRSDICIFSVKDAFEIKHPGEYELHLQMRLVQIGKDSSGKIHYPVTWLPEVVAKVQITPEGVSN